MKTHTGPQNKHPYRHKLELQKDKVQAPKKKRKRDINEEKVLMKPKPKAKIANSSDMQTTKCSLSSFKLSDTWDEEKEKE